ncbi:MAG TPA: hypothetical protein VMB73_04820 [Acetobacteraceae bacterium]|nr:hypothetical protein [Acetobacteraceae bacterium]
MTAPMPDREQILALAAQAGLTLPAAYEDELVAAYANVRRMIDRLPANRPRGDEPAHVFVPTKFLPTEN